MRDFIYYLKDKYGDAPIGGVEVGVFKGENAKEMLDNLNIYKLYLVDPWIGIGFEPWIRKEARERLHKYENKIIWKECEFAKCDEWEYDDVDFVYIDGNHEYAEVVKDISLAMNITRGVVCGHDFNLDGVSNAVKEYCSTNRYTYMVRGKDWIIKR